MRVFELKKVLRFFDEDLSVRLVKKEDLNPDLIAELIEQQRGLSVSMSDYKGYTGLGAIAPKAKYLLVRIGIKVDCPYKLIRKTTIEKLIAQKIEFAQGKRAEELKEKIRKRNAKQRFKESIFSHPVLRAKMIEEDKRYEEEQRLKRAAEKNKQ